MKLMNERNKLIAAVSLSLLLGMAGGIAIKESVDKTSAAQAAEPASVPVQKVTDNESGKYNHLISPHLWDIYLDPLWMPANFAVKSLPLAPLMSYSADVPKIQTVDRPDELRIVAQVPGLSEKDINVQASDSTITIKGHTAKENKDKTHFESVDESFQQTVNLPCKVNADKVQATVKDGILTISLPKQNAEKSVAKASNAL